MEEARATWRESAEAFWAHQAGLGEKNKKQKVPERTSALRWLTATEHMLRAATGCGWERFFVNETNAVVMSSPATWPSATLCIDQGSDGWSAGFFLMSKCRANVLLVPDPSHRTWNDVELSLHDCDMWMNCLTWMSVMCIDQGPWNGARWFQEGKEAVEDVSVTFTYLSNNWIMRYHPQYFRSNISSNISHREISSAIV